MTTQQARNLSYEDLNWQLSSAKQALRNSSHPLIKAQVEQTLRVLNKEAALRQANAVREMVFHNNKNVRRCN